MNMEEQAPSVAVKIVLKDHLSILLRKVNKSTRCSCARLSSSQGVSAPKVCSLLKCIKGVVIHLLDSPSLHLLSELMLQV